jgi:DNA-binding CsgD family transcriptional regulator
VANISLQAAEARMRRGDVRGAAALYARVLGVASVMDDRAWIASCHSSLAVTASLLGEDESARLHLDAARRSAGELTPADQIAVLSSTGIAALLLGDATAAVEQFRVARAATLDLRLHDCNALPFRAQMVEALLVVGAADEARSVADELMRFAARAGRTRGIGDAHRAAALLAAADGDLDTARSSIHAAITEHDRLPGPIESAWSHLVAGVVERRSRRRAVARGHFEQARETFRSVGADVLAERADLELARTGAPVARLGELTPSETQVAQLVALGYTNAEVSAQLHMSTKTVEANLTRIYRKMGVRSRTELAARTVT